MSMQDRETARLLLRNQQNALQSRLIQERQYVRYRPLDGRRGVCRGGVRVELTSLMAA
jgi:hypothetical protein